MLARNEKADVHYYQVGFGLQIKWAKKESFNSQIHNQSINNKKKNVHTKDEILQKLKN